MEEAVIYYPVLHCCTTWCVFAGGRNEELNIRGIVNTDFPEAALGNLSFLPISGRPENRRSKGILSTLSREKYSGYPLKQ